MGKGWEKVCGGIRGKSGGGEWGSSGRMVEESVGAEEMWVGSWWGGEKKFKK